MRLLASLLLLACGSGDNGASPFVTHDAGADAGGAGGAITGGASGTSGTTGASGSSGSAGGFLGRPCTRDTDCDDTIPCTVDRCDPEALRCHSDPDDTTCQDGVFCNGEEQCLAGVGCVAGTAIACSDDDVCTIDRCDEETTLCQHVPRDADGDGDVDEHCGGHDCNDTNPLVFSTADEICGNAIDDDCDGQIDEAGCSSPAHDTCSTALDLDGPGSYSFTTIGAALDTPASCVTFASGMGRDVVAALTIPPGPSQRVDLKVRSTTVSVGVALSSVCGDPSSEIACSGTFVTPSSGPVAAARAWSVPPGVYAIEVYTDGPGTAILEVSLSAATAAPSNETCGTATTIPPDTTIDVPLFGVTPDVTTACIAATGDLLYKLELGAAYDVRTFASASDGISPIAVSIRDAECASAEAEIACRSSNPVSLLTRNLGPGDVFVSVRASYPVDASLLVTLEPPTSPPADDLCATAPSITPGVWTPIDLTDHGDDISLCSSGEPDAFGTLTLDAPSDVLAIFSTGSAGIRSVSIVDGACDALTNVTCTPLGSSPIRAAAYGLAAGTYHVVTESTAGVGAKRSVLVRSPEIPQLVPFADTCDDAQLIPPSGGRFQGNTANANAQYPAGCDQGGGSPFGAPEQMLKLVLDAKKRVVLDTHGSSYATMIDVREASQCPGTEVSLGCSISPDANRAFLDLTLDAGTYFVQVDGFNGASGAWMLDVWVTDPNLSP